MNNFKIALLICAAAAPLPALAQAAPAEPAPPPPLGFIETALENDGLLDGVAAPFISGGAIVFVPAVAEDPDTTAIEAKPAVLRANAVGIGTDPATLTIGAANASSNGSTTITAAVLDDEETLDVNEAKPAVASTAVTETNASLNSGGATFSKYTGTATCNLNADEDACDGEGVYDVTAFVGSTAVTADGVTVVAGEKTVSLTGNGLDNGGNKLVGVADGVADTDAVNFRQLDTVRTSLTTETNNRIAADTALRNDLTAETNSRIAADNLLRDQIASSTATAIALGGAVILPDVNFSLSGNVGFYEGATALALNAAARLAPNTYVTGAIGGGLNKNGAVGGRVGFAFGF